MPIYEYRCGNCRKRSSALLQSFASPNPECPHCGQEKLERLVSTFATVRSEGGGGDYADFGEDAYEGGDFGAGDADDDF